MGIFCYNIDMVKEELKKDDSIEYNTKLWIDEVDKDKEELEDFERNKIDKSKNFSWILIVLILFFITILGEGIIYILGNYFFIKKIKIIVLIWIWRFILINFYLLIAFFKMHLPKDKIFIIAIISFFFSSLASIILKILFIKSLWVYLNLLVEPIWVILLIILIGSLYKKFIFKY